MSRRGICWDNSVAEAFFSNLKKERIRGKTYSSREEARQDVSITSRCFTTGNAATLTLAA